MANAIIKNPWSIGTADATADIIGATRRVKIWCIYWTGDVGTGDQVQLTDSDDYIIYHAWGTASYVNTPIYVNMWLRDGLRCSKLDRGILYLYLAES